MGKESLTIIQRAEKAAVEADLIAQRRQTLGRIGRAPDVQLRIPDPIRTSQEIKLSVRIAKARKFLEAHIKDREADLAELEADLSPDTLRAAVPEYLEELASKRELIQFIEGGFLEEAEDDLPRYKKELAALTLLPQRYPALQEGIDALQATAKAPAPQSEPVKTEPSPVVTESTAAAKARSTVSRRPAVTPSEPVTHLQPAEGGKHDDRTRKLLALLAGSSQGHKVKSDDLCRELGISKETLRRMVGRLRTEGIEIMGLRGKTGGYWIEESVGKTGRAQVDIRPDASNAGEVVIDPYVLALAKFLNGATQEQLIETLSVTGTRDGAQVGQDLLDIVDRLFADPTYMESVTPGLSQRFTKDDLVRAIKTTYAISEGEERLKLPRSVKLTQLEQAIYSALQKDSSIMSVLDLHDLKRKAGEYIAEGRNPVVAIQTAIQTLRKKLAPYGQEITQADQLAGDEKKGYYLRRANPHVEVKPAAKVSPVESVKLIELPVGEPEFGSLSVIDVAVLAAALKSHSLLLNAVLQQENNRDSRKIDPAMMQEIADLMVAALPPGTDLAKVRDNALTKAKAIISSDSFENQWMEIDEKNTNVASLLLYIADLDEVQGLLNGDPRKITAIEFLRKLLVDPTIGESGFTIVTAAGEVLGTIYEKFRKGAIEVEIRTNTDKGVNTQLIFDGGEREPAPWYVREPMTAAELRVEARRLDEQTDRRSGDVLDGAVEADEETDSAPVTPLVMPRQRRESRPKGLEGRYPNIRVTINSLLDEVLSHSSLVGSASGLTSPGNVTRVYPYLKKHFLDPLITEGFVPVEEEGGKMQIGAVGIVTALYFYNLRNNIHSLDKALKDEVKEIVAGEYRKKQAKQEA